jgi:hypothetical protein
METLIACVLIGAVWSVFVSEKGKYWITAAGIAATAFVIHVVIH